MTAPEWSDGDDEKLKKLYKNTGPEYLRELFGRSDKSIYARAKKFGLKKTKAYMEGVTDGQFSSENNTQGSSTRFRVGHRPHNTGKRGWSPGGKSLSTRFQPGSVPPVKHDIGTIIHRGDYLQRKVADNGDNDKNWVNVHILNWIEHHGKIPPDHCVIFLDGNTLNPKIENLECVSRRELAYMNRNSYSGLSPELRRVAVNLARIECKRVEMEKAR